MNDRCLHRVRTWTTNTYGEQIELLVDDQEYACGLDTTSTTEITTQGEIRIIDATLRMSLTLEGVISADDQIVILERFGRTLVRQPLFEIQGEPLVGPTAIVLKLQEVRT